MINKAFKSVDCKEIACTFFDKCNHVATEIVKCRKSDRIDIMFVGQGAGAKEDSNGKPFQGSAGILLRTKLKPLIEKHELNIILDNIIRSRPLDSKGKNRAPTEKEVQFCIKHLWDRIEEFKPTIVVPLGKSATEAMIPNKAKGKSISALRGSFYQEGGVRYLPTFHPAAILHCGDEERKVELEKSMCRDIERAVAFSKPNPKLL